MRRRYLLPAQLLESHGSSARASSFDNRTRRGYDVRKSHTSPVTTLTTRTSRSKASALAADIKRWWKEECTNWDAAVTGADPASLPGGADLWDDMPTVDSKAVARTSPIFERHLGIPLAVKLIRHGGYASIDDAIADLVPKMEAAAKQNVGHGVQKGGQP